MRKIRQIIGLALTTLALVSLAIGTSGCNKTTLDPAGVYQGDKILYTAEKTITTSYQTFDSFLKWETAYRQLLPVEVSRAADVIRLNAKKWIESASTLRDTYVAQPTGPNRDKLNETLNLIESALLEASKYMTDFKAVAPPKTTTVYGPFDRPVPDAYILDDYPLLKTTFELNLERYGPLEPGPRLPVLRF
jgi:hypothetical protein